MESGEWWVGMVLVVVSGGWEGWWWVGSGGWEGGWAKAEPSISAVTSKSA